MWSISFNARNHERLENAILSDGFREVVERSFFKLTTRLEWIWLYLLDVDEEDRIAIEIGHAISVT